MANKFLLAISLFLISLIGNSQILINEFSASNSGSVVDPDFQSSSDWLELYNAGVTEINLKGYYLTDDSLDLSKWSIKSDLIISSKGFVIIWCDGLDTLNTHANFKLAAEGEHIVLSNSALSIQDSYHYTPQESNISTGRICDGCTEWVFYTTPTPGETNTGISFNGIILSSPNFYPKGGIYSSTQQVEIKNLFEGEIRYTLDGSEPDINSSLYTSPIQLDTNTVLRARILNGDSLRPGPVATQSYFFKNNLTETLPVVSIATHPANFWDPIKGIYVQDFKPEWEVPVNIELYENDGSDRAAFNLQAGVKINGLYSWQLPQKMLGIYFRKEYGSGSLDYPVILDVNARSYDNFALRASGNDWSDTMFKDALFQKSTQLNMDNEYQGYRPAVLYVNGQYMGINNLRQKIDEDFIVNELGMDGGSIDMIENESYVEAGSIDAYASFESEYQNDLSVQTNYDAVAEKMDIQNFMDFMICELFTNNTSTGHNVMAWKPKVGGKWRWILNDFDRGFVDPETNLSSTYIDKSIYPMAQLMKNEGFKTAFGFRLADHLYSTFNYQRYSDLIHHNANLIRDEIERHIARWEGTSSNYGDPIPSLYYWENKMSDISTYVAQRGKLLLAEWASKYGLGNAVELSINNHPLNAGNIKLNSLNLPSPFTTGVYPQASTIKLHAEAKPGFAFKAWKLASDTAVIPLQSYWKYYDKTNTLPSTWITKSFDDSSWSEGQAEFGYGETDENTKLSYGSSSSNKIISYYFRKKFNINNLNSKTSPRISLKVDDAAVIYINGKEVIRFNLQEGELTASSVASREIPNEKLFTEFTLDENLLLEGENWIAVEVHQINASSSDVSFDMKLIMSDLNAAIVSTNNELSYEIGANTSLIAEYESLDKCIIPSRISGSYKLERACSPYYSQGDVTIDFGSTLEIEPGVEIYMSNDANIYVMGKIVAIGTAQLPVKFTTELNEGRWGAIVLKNTSDTTILSHCELINASKGKHPVSEVAAISAFNAQGRFDHLTISQVYANPITARYSDMVISDSYLHSNITGDLINFKYGKGQVYNTEFTGNDKPDTDAIDYDDIENGIIQGNFIHDFHGLNSDAIDIGEEAKNSLITDNFVYNITDKGVSVGQLSSAKITNSTFVNCNLGAGLKDSSYTIIENNTYFGCVTPVAAYEKNPGSAGGNAIISRNIFANIYGGLYISDEKSKTVFRNNLADVDTLLSDLGNLIGDPLFSAANDYDFNLEANSPAIDPSGNLGASIKSVETYSFPVISSICRGNIDINLPEFIILRNLNEYEFDISAYTFTDGVDWIAPEGTTIPAKGRIILTSDSNHTFWANIADKKYQWDAGKINNTGEILQFRTFSGMIADQIQYSVTEPWPVESDLISLKNTSLDNHYGKNWEVETVEQLFTSTVNSATTERLKVYPNPAREYTEIEIEDTLSSIRIMDVLGKTIEVITPISLRNRINLNDYKKGIYIVQYKSESRKLVVN